MATLIRHRQIVTDSWQLLKPAAGGSSSYVSPAGDVIVPLAFWLERREFLLSRAGRLGVCRIKTFRPMQNEEIR